MTKRTETPTTAQYMAALDAFCRTEAAREAVALVRETRTTAARVTAEVAALVAPLFTAFVADEPLMTKVFKSRGAPKAPEQILTEDKLYMADEADDARVREYYDARDALLQARYELPGKDYCPAAMAKCARSAAETALLQAVDTACGTRFDYALMERRREAMTLVMAAVDALPR